MKILILALSVIFLNSACGRKAGTGGADFSSTSADITYHNYQTVTEDAVNEKAFRYISIEIQQNQNFVLKEYLSLDGTSGKACEVQGTWEIPEPTEAMGNVLRVQVGSVNGGAGGQTYDYELQNVSYDTLRVRLSSEAPVTDLTNQVLVPAYSELSGVSLGGFAADGFCAQ